MVEKLEASVLRLQRATWLISPLMLLSELIPIAKYLDVRNPPIGDVLAIDGESSRLH